jgi:hypothetical protein
MAQIHKPQDVKLVVGMLSAYSAAFEKAQRALSGRYGPVDLESLEIAFTFTRYYEKEMGPNLLRKFISFEELIDPAILPDVKLFTNELEVKLAPEITDCFSRPINVDPGYMTAAKLVLASAKDFSHRVYLRDGIFAEVTLHYARGGTFRSWPWTFPDFASSRDYHAFLLRVRQRCVEQIAADNSSGS